MTTSHPMTIASFVFVVGLLSSVSGRLDLRAFGDDDVPFVFGCGRRRCGRLSTTPHHRQWSGVRGLDRPDGVDDLPSRNDDVEAVEHFRAFDDDDDRRMMTFPYCSEMSADECRSLLGRMEQLRRRRLGRVNKQNVVVSGTDGTVVRLLGRRRRSTQGVDTGNEKETEAPQQRAVRTVSGYAPFDATNGLLAQYREWREQNGYGSYGARWGRAGPPADREGREAAHHQGSWDVKSGKDANNITVNDAKLHHKTRRSVVVEIEREKELPDNERDMLDTYLAWRETHGYGTLAGRWG